MKHIRPKKKSIILKIIELFSFGCAGSLLLHGLSLVVVSRVYTPVVMHGLLIAVAFLGAEHGLQGAQTLVGFPGSRAQTQ